MPRMEQTLVSYLSPEKSASLEAPRLPSRPLRNTSALFGKAYASAGQATPCLHTMAVLQAYLLGGLNNGKEADQEAVRELHRDAYLSEPLRKQPE